MRPDLKPPVAASILLRLLSVALLLPFARAAAEDYDALNNGVVKVFSISRDGMRRTGTGFIVRLESDAAYIVTARHVVEGDKHPSVYFYARRNVPIPAESVKSDTKLDAALLIVRGRDNLPQGARALPLEGDQSLKRGDDVTTIGFPAGLGDWALTRATIASQEGSDLTLSGAIAEGSSGAPVLRDGRVVAMVSAVQGIAGRATPALLLRYALKGWGVEADTGGQARGAVTAPVLTTPATPATPAPTGPQAADRSLSNTDSRRARKSSVPATMVAELKFEDLLKEQSVAREVQFSPDGRLLASTHLGGELRLWDVATRKAIREPAHLDELTFYGDGKPVFTGDGKSLVFFSAAGIITVLDLASGVPHRTIDVRAIHVPGGLALSPDGTTLAVGGQPVSLWDLPSGKLIGKLSATELAYHFAFSPDGKVLATVDRVAGGGKFRLWDIASLQPIGSPLVGGQPIAFSPDGRMLAAYAYGRGGVLLWDVTSRKPTARIDYPGVGEARVLAFTPDGKILAISTQPHISHSNTITFWDPGNQVMIGEPLGAALGIAFSPDGKLMAVAAGSLTLWELTF